MAKRKKTDSTVNRRDATFHPTDQTAQGMSGNSFTSHPFKELEKIKPLLRHKEERAGSHQVTDADRELFIKTALNGNIPKKNSELSGFLLCDQCALPRLMSKKKKKPPVTADPEKKVDPVMEDDDNSDFLLAMRATKPLTGKGRDIAKRPDLKDRIINEQCFEELLNAQTEFTLHYSDEYLEGKVTSLDEMIMNRLRQGQMSPEAHLDLHGLNAEQAFESMRIFIRDAWFKGMRVVLLVPGRGRNSPAGMAILRRKVQDWLIHEPFKRVVLAFCTAKAHDGGPGSIYVLLRKFRKKGHISWNRLSSDPDLYDS